MAFFAVAFFFLWTPSAEASVSVEGSREFRDDVNECLATYRNNPGLVGDVIRELENSGNTHKITEGPDWSNTPDTNDDAFNGNGTGTETKISKAELERVKARVPELKDKDFCTAMLHELWHAVEADRGEWSNDTTDGVYDDEIQAVMFQNFLHAIRGVDPRTAYGGTSIAGHLGIEVPEPEEAVEAIEISAEMSYDHVAPGSYSEVYLVVNTTPGVTVDVSLAGPGVFSASDQSQTADADGKAKFTWRIVSYGAYEVTGMVAGTPFTSSVNVQ
ncbi:hypothetical protein AMJ57_02180 [Parcubacteria bacterium SG8_24]|nr:MAG: hypothetical protein AMJ57_02180 [Parcubacteria bacterium SG8_24]